MYLSNTDNQFIKGDVTSNLTERQSFIILLEMHYSSLSCDQVSFDKK